MYIRYLCAEFDIMYIYVVHVCVLCAGMSVSECVCEVHNLTRDYMSPTELMSKSTGSALGLTGGRAERKRDRMAMREGEVEIQRKTG